MPPGSRTAFEVVVVDLLHEQVLANSGFGKHPAAAIENERVAHADPGTPENATILQLRHNDIRAHHVHVVVNRDRNVVLPHSPGVVGKSFVVDVVEMRRENQLSALHCQNSRGLQKRGVRTNDEP